MNIKQAKNYIEDSVRIYLKKNEFGEYRIPVVRQRPIFLLGAPGIGKTAIMEQIAQEMGIALVSYSMTHHTRQSALGLPFITRRIYDGRETDVTEYTMSEIISSIYETMEASGIREGILFLDEINCVSETLAPSMLQFLQYKVFGRHQVPEGWVIVTAGNPPEYNRSVREFDVVTYDRLKVLEVEPDYAAWKEYASERRLHGAILSYLDLKKEHFYYMETTAKGRRFVTARGWEDLSRILELYEEEGLPVDETLVGQYLRNDRVVKEFAAYYDLYQKYKKDYRIGEILAGRPSARALERAGQAPFDERLSLLGMLLDRVKADMKEVCCKAACLSELKAPLLAVKKAGQDPILPLLEKQAEGRRKAMEARKKANSLSEDAKRQYRFIIDFLEEGKKVLAENGIMTGEQAFGPLKERFDALVTGLRREAEEAGAKLHALFDFVEKVFQEGNEMLVLVTELTVDRYSSRFLADFGSSDYQRHSEELMLTQRQEELRARIAELQL